ncbi:hypothetical protein BDR07DRAFT_1609717 [Suillus spraguei]|nr:hypothetical protein BDR07DRAFT_1609717 [Suillus spraguei]
MTHVSNNPAWWPYIEWCYIFNYFIVASSTVVVYDWVLTFAQEFDLVWRRRWSFLTVLYVCVRCVGVLYSVVYIVANLPVSFTDAGTILYFMQIWIPVVVNAMLGVIMMIRIRAMYEGSKKMLIFLGIVLLTCTVASGVMTGIGNVKASAEEVVLSGNRMCLSTGSKLNQELFVPTLVWEIIAIFLAARIVIKHIHELQQSQTGSTIEDYYTVLIRSHVPYFIGFAAVTCFNLGTLSPTVATTTVGSGIYYGIFQIAQFVQMFVLGPRLILSIREYHAELVANSDAGTAITTIGFLEQRHVSTNDSV